MSIRKHNANQSNGAMGEDESPDNMHYILPYRLIHENNILILIGRKG